jgi:hypothetical protein
MALKRARRAGRAGRAGRGSGQAGKRAGRASRQAGRAGKQASRQAGKQASRQAGKQASRQAGKQASGQAGKQASGQAGLCASDLLPVSSRRLCLLQLPALPVCQLCLFASFASFACCPFANVFQSSSVSSLFLGPHPVGGGPRKSPDTGGPICNASALWISQSLSHGQVVPWLSLFIFAISSRGRLRVSPSTSPRARRSRRRAIVRASTRSRSVHCVSRK